MKKLIFPILLTIPFLFSQCGSENKENNNGPTETNNDVDTSSQVSGSVDNLEEVDVENVARVKEEVYKYLFEKHIAPVKDGLHKYTLIFDEESKSFELKFSISTIETIDVEKEIDGNIEYVEEDMDVIDELSVVGNWNVGDQENGIAVVSLSGERKFTDNYYNVYGSLMGSDKVKEFSDEISIDFNKSPQSDFFGSDLYKKAVSEKLKAEDLNDLSKDELAYLRNEIFARRGHTFSTEKMSAYFGQKPWYRSFNQDATKTLSPIEKQNAEFIKSVESTK